jgi:pimeloyl-ACP methyl ester carboxylesterase
MIKLLDILKEITEKNTERLLTKHSDGGKTLILIPGSGGNAADDFKSLIKNLSNSFSIYTVNFPNKVDVRKYTEQIANEINNDPNINDFAVGGYSIGGAMAWHLCRQLQKLESENKLRKEFENKLFFIDSGIPNSTQEFAKGLDKENPPRIAIAWPLDVFKRVRKGSPVSDSEAEEKGRRFFNTSKLNAFKEENEGNYLEYTGSEFPPPTDSGLDADAKKIGQTNPWIIEDKFDTTNFKKRFSNMVKIGADVAGKTFEEGDPIIIQKVQETDTLKKKGLGRETGDPRNPTLPPLSGVEIISIMAGLDKSGKPRSQDEKNKTELSNKAASTNKNSNTIFIDDADHQNIVNSPELAKVIQQNF